ncbi:unnamed protein product, partial [Closterium sp. NIES-54]
MATLNVLTFDREGRPIQFDTWLDDLQLYLLSDPRDGVSLFDLTSGASLAPPDTPDSTTRSQWLTRDATARLAVRDHLPLAKRVHFGQHEIAKAFYDAVVTLYSSPATAALAHLILPYPFPELGVPPPPLPPLSLLLLLLSSFVLRRSGLHLLLVRGAAAARAREARVVGVAAVEAVVGAMEAVELAVVAEGVVVGVEAVLVAVVGVVAVAVVAFRVELVRGEVLAVVRGSSSSVRVRPLRPRSFGDCYLCVPPDPGMAAAALGASESALPCTAPAEALHTFTLDSGASRCFFRDSTIVTPLPAHVAVRPADPSGGPVLARSSTVLPCPEVPSGSLSGLHLPSFSTNLVSTAALQDAMVTTTTTGGPVAAPFSCRLLSHQTLLWHHRLGHPSLPRLCGMHSRLLVSGLPRSLPPLPPSPAPPCLPCVEGRQRAGPHSSSLPPTTAPMQTLHMDVWGPSRVRGQGREQYFML